MLLPLASIYEIVLGAHRISAFLLVLFMLTLTVMSILSRHQDGLLEQTEPLVKLAGPLLVLVVITGAYQLIELGVKFFQLWIVGALVLGIAVLGVLHGFWWPRAQALSSGESRGSLIGAALAMLVMIFAAMYLMETRGL